MAYVTVDYLRKHSLISVENDPDDYLEHLLDTAEQAVEKDITCTFEAVMTEAGRLPSPLYHAVLLQAANFYENREPLAYGKVTTRHYNYSYLISPYIKLT